MRSMHVIQYFRCGILKMKASVAYVVPPTDIACRFARGLPKYSIDADWAVSTRSSSSRMLPSYIGLAFTIITTHSRVSSPTDATASDAASTSTSHSSRDAVFGPAAIRPAWVGADILDQRASEEDHSAFRADEREGGLALDRQQIPHHRPRIRCTRRGSGRIRFASSFWSRRGGLQHCVYLQAVSYSITYCSCPGRYVMSATLGVKPTRQFRILTVCLQVSMRR